MTRFYWLPIWILSPATPNLSMPCRTAANSPFSHPVRYFVISLAAIIIALAALGALIAAHRSQAWRRRRSICAWPVLAAVIVFPWTHTPYKPAIATHPDTDLRLVNRPAGLLAGAVRGLQAGAEVRPEVYEPLGWADDQRSANRMRQGAGYYGAAMARRHSWAAHGI